MTTKKTNTRFHIDFANKKIVGFEASFKKAGKGFGPEFEELARLIALQPNYDFEVKVPEMRSDKPKRTYKGLNIPFIRDFLTANDDLITLKQVDDVIAFAKANKEHSYPLVKRVFLRTYDCFDYADAKQLVAEYRAEQKLAKANAMAEKISATAA